MKGATVLFTEMAPDTDWEDEFNEWYDTHQIPQRMAVPGFIGAQRYKDPERPNYLTVFEVESPSVLEGGTYQEVRARPHAATRWMLDNVTGSSRYLGNKISELRQEGLGEEPLDADSLFAVFFSVPDERAGEFNSWYDEEHSPMLLKCKDWLMVRRFEIYDGEPQPWTHLALHYLRDGSALESPELEAARNTEWRARLATESWFKGSFQYYERVGERFLADNTNER